MTWRSADILTRDEAYHYGGSLMMAPPHPLPTGLKAWDGACSETGELGLGGWW